MAGIWEDLKHLKTQARQGTSSSDRARLLVSECLMDLEKRISLIERRYVKKRTRPAPPSREDWVIQGYTKEGVPVFGVQEIKK